MATLAMVRGITFSPAKQVRVISAGRACLRHCGEHSAGRDDHQRELEHADVEGRSKSQPTIELHKLMVDWGEGASNANGKEGQGAPATTNDATWRHRFYGATFWTSARRGLFCHRQRKPVGWRSWNLHVELGPDSR